MVHILKTLAGSIREYKKPSLLAPVLVTGEVVMECIIPFIIANLVNEIQMGIDMPTLLRYGAILIVMAGLFPGLRRSGGQGVLHRQLRLCPQPAQGHVL